MTPRGESVPPARRRRAAAGAVAWALSAGVAGATSPALEHALLSAAETARTAGVDSARAQLAPWFEPTVEPDDAATVRGVVGLLAFVAGRQDDAIEWLSAGASGELDDWRLWALASAYAAVGEPAAENAALGALLADHPDSPLAPRAVVRRVESARLAGDPVEARRRLVAARRERLPDAERARLERIAWDLAIATDDNALLAQAARHLLVLAPLEASRLRVVDIVAGRRAAGSDWRLWLSPGELVQRADALLAVELPAGALTTLAAVPVESRDLDWRLLEARALTAAERAAEAYATLSEPLAGAAGRRAEIEWERARAANAAGTRRGRPLDGEPAARYRRAAREHLLAVVRHDASGALAARALERLAGEYLDQEKLVEAVAALRQLVALRPDSTAGAQRLWEHGWSAYQMGDGARAVEVWSDLVALYPRSVAARGGRYWTARVLDARGDGEGAKRLYLELLAADIADFYARQAGLRLAGATQTIAGAPPERERWPASPRLGRAERLSRLGLDALASEEIALVGTDVEPRAKAALTAVVAARLGDRRASLRALREAFPDLGTVHQARVPKDALELFYPVDFRQSVVRAAARERLASSLVFGMIHQESAFDADARSSSGARGLMQLLPSTGREVARRLGLPFSTARLHEPETSLRLGTHYFRQMLDRFDGNVELALAGYNGGPGRISRLWRAAGPDAELDRFLEGLSVGESRRYVKRILVLADSYRSLYPDLG